MSVFFKQQLRTGLTKNEKRKKKGDNLVPNFPNISAVLSKFMALLTWS